jgi:hypothetical protein
MRQLIVVGFRKLQCLTSILLASVIILSACSGGGSNTPSPNPSSAASSSSMLSSSSASSVIETVNLSGTLTYDYVPHNVNHIGLNYAAIEQRPIRGAVVELIDNSGQVKATTNSTADGAFSLAVQKNINVKVRVKAQLLKKESPSWNFKVTDNTANNALYVLDGQLASTGATDSTRALNAGSGWDGSSYATTRSAAPFAILDDIYIGVNRVAAAGNTENLSPLELHWSTKNSEADGDYDKGEIGTSFYDGSAIYILGDANSDTDEYDPHVLLHEWGHYLEDELFRSDSLGGEHSDGEFLDIRVAMSEGFANAFSGMMTNDNNYMDASDTNQAEGFTFNIARKVRPNRGYFSEGSVGSIFYNFYTSSTNKTADDFTSIFKTLSHASYYANDAFTSIYLFQAQLKTLFPEYIALLESLMQEQLIFGTDEFGTGETNNGGLAVELPIYKNVTVNNIPVNVCSDAEYGEQNRLGNAQFVKLNITFAGNYKINLVKSGGDMVSSKPEFLVYRKGEEIIYDSVSVNDGVSGTLNLSSGIYMIEAYDYNNFDGENTDARNKTCFDLSVTAN